MRIVLRTLTASILALGVAGAAAAPASAAPADAADSRDRGSTAVVIAPDVYDLLAGAGIEVAPRGKATAAPFMGTVKAEFPISKIRGEGNRIDHKGGLTFSLDDLSITTKKFRILLAEGTVSGKTKGSEIGSAGRVPLFTLAATDDPELGAVQLLLTDTAAGAINATFGTTLEEGDLFGYATPEPRS